MSWLNLMLQRGLVILLAILVLAACGFQPIYGAHTDKGPVADELSQIAIANIPDRPGQILKNDLIDRMYRKGRPGSPKYKLAVKLRTTEEDVGIQANATTTRALVNTYADYTLTDMIDNKLFEATAHSVTSFDTLDQQYGTQVARDSATQRTVDEVSEQIVNALSLYLAEKTKDDDPLPK